MAGKISEYQNNGNISDWDLMDYSHENEQGSGIWETRSITLAQLQTALGGGGSGNNLAVADQTLNSPRTITGNVSNTLTVKEVPSFTVETNVVNTEFSLYGVSSNSNLLTTQGVNDLNSTGTDNLDVISQAASLNTQAKTIEQINSSKGHQISFTNNENGAIIDRIFDINDPNKGIYVTKDLQSFIGTTSDVIQSDVCQSWNDNDRVIRIPRLSKENENQLQLQNAKLWLDEGGEIAYMDTVGIRRVQHYGQKGYTQLTDSGAGVYSWDMRTSYSATIIAPTTANLTLEITNVNDGDFGNIIFDDSAGSSFVSLALPTNGGNSSKVANNGSGAIAFPAGKISTASFTFTNQVFYWVFALEYT